MHAYPSSKYALPHWKCVLRCSEKCPWIDLPSTESDNKNSNTILTLRFHIYQKITRCTVHDRRTLNKNTRVNFVRLL